MTYYHPRKGGLREHKMLGPLRIFTSRERAAQMVRRFLLQCLGLFTCVVVVPLWPVLVAVIAWSMWNIHSMWRDAISGVPSPEGQFFYDSDTSPAPPSGRGILFERNQEGGEKPAWKPIPTPSTASVDRNSFLYSPVAQGTFFFYQLFFGVEYYVRDMVRYMLHYSGIRLFADAYDGKTVPSTLNRSEVFDLVVDTSVACYVEPEPGVDARKKIRVVLRDFELFWCDTATRRFRELRVFLDTNFDPDVDRHDSHRGQFRGLELEYTSLSGEVVIQAWGFPNNGDEDAVDGHPSTVVDFQRSRNYTGNRNLNSHERFVQGGKLMAAVFSYFTHSATHWWANGAVHVPNSVWSDVNRSLDVTLFMNIAATYISCDYQGTTRKNTAAVLAQNATHGLPFHSPEKQAQDAMWVIGEMSTFHQMSKAAKTAIIPLVAESLPCRTPYNRQFVDTIIAATVMHAADHYCAAKFAHVFGQCQCVPLETDFSGQFMGLIMNQRFIILPYLFGRKLLLKESKSAISQEIYKQVRCYDRTFADQYLTVGCAA